jgi:hypothetical protein
MKPSFALARTAFTLLSLVAVTLLAGCSSVVFLGGGPPIPRTASWEEEAVLPDGRTVKVARTAYFDVSLLPTVPDQPSRTLKDQAMTFADPDEPGRKIRWRAGGPCSRYVVFRLKDGEWERIDAKEFEPGAVRRNLTRDAYYFLKHSQFDVLTAQQVTAFNARYRWDGPDPLHADLRRIVVGNAKCFGLRPFPEAVPATLSPTDTVAPGTEPGAPGRRRLITEYNCSAYLTRATHLNGNLFRFVHDSSRMKVLEKLGSQGLACTEQGVFYFRSSSRQMPGEWFLARYSTAGELLYYARFVAPRSDTGFPPTAVAADTLTVRDGKIAFAMAYELDQPWPIFELQEPGP